MTIAAVWGLVGMPTLCRGGILVECCVPPQCAEEGSCGFSDASSTSCPHESSDRCPGDTESSDERDCSSCRECSFCADICNSASLTTGKLGVENLKITIAPVVLTTESLAGGPPSIHHASPVDSHRHLHENLPFPPSDRPLLI